MSQRHCRERATRLNSRRSGPQCSPLSHIHLRDSEQQGVRESHPLGGLVAPVALLHADQWACAADTNGPLAKRQAPGPAGRCWGTGKCEELRQAWHTWSWSAESPQPHQVALFLQSQASPRGSLRPQVPRSRPRDPARREVGESQRKMLNPNGKASLAAGETSASNIQRWHCTLQLPLLHPKGWVWALPAGSPATPIPGAPK